MVSLRKHWLSDDYLLTRLLAGYQRCINRISKQQARSSRVGPCQSRRVCIRRPLDPRRRIRSRPDSHGPSCPQTQNRQQHTVSRRYIADDRPLRQPRIGIDAVVLVEGLGWRPRWRSDRSSHNLHTSATWQQTIPELLIGS